MKITAPRSITLPIVLASITVPMGIFVMTGWILVLLRNQELSEQVASNTWLMVSGIISLVTIMAAIITLTVFLTREILEGRRQTRFIDSVTHELKSPLASLRLCVQTLNRRELQNTQKKKMHQMMLDDIDRLSFFIDDILEASRLAHGPRNQLLAHIDLRELTENCARQVKKRHKLPEGSININIEKNLDIFADTTALEMVMRNLLDNAAKYSNELIDIDVKASQSSNHRVTISVTDKGIGIPLYQSQRIFERFYRAPTEEVHRRSGTGIGLYVAAQLVHNLGGKLIVHSEGLHKGSTFSFSLPLYQEQENI